MGGPQAKRSGGAGQGGTPTLWWILGLGLGVAAGYKPMRRISYYKLYVPPGRVTFNLIEEQNMSLNVDAIKAAITAGGRGSEVMRDVVMSSYKRNIQMSLANLSALDNENLQLAIDVMKYRRQPRWSDDVFCELYVFATDFID